MKFFKMGFDFEPWTASTIHIAIICYTVIRCFAIAYS